MRKPAMRIEILFGAQTLKEDIRKMVDTLTAKFEELKASVEAERGEVKDALEALKAKLEAKDQLNAEEVSEAVAQIDSVIASVQSIVTPDVPAEEAAEESIF